MPIDDPDEEEAPLDPAAERLRRKLTRLLLVSSAVMALGFIAVFAAIVYRLSDAGEAGGEVSGASPGAVLAIPAGARIVSADLDGTRALLIVEGADGANSLLLLDLSSGRVVGRYAVHPQ